MAHAHSVVDLSGKQDPDGLDNQQTVCANPRCDVQFVQSAGRGRRRDFHDEECRRAAERDLRRTRGLIDHLERQLEELSARAGAYVRTSVDDGGAGGRTASERQAAREAVIRAQGIAPFLEKNDDHVASEMLRLLRAVEPLFSDQ